MVCGGRNPPTTNFHIVNSNECRHGKRKCHATSASENSRNRSRRSRISSVLATTVMVNFSYAMHLRARRAFRTESCNLQIVFCKYSTLKRVAALGWKDRLRMMRSLDGTRMVFGKMSTSSFRSIYLYSQLFFAAVCLFSISLVMYGSASISQRQQRLCSWVWQSHWLFGLLGDTIWVLTRREISTLLSWDFHRMFSFSRFFLPSYSTGNAASKLVVKQLNSMHVMECLSTPWVSEISYIFFCWEWDKKTRKTYCHFQHLLSILCGTYIW